MAYMDYMDPDVLCPKKADKLNISLSLLYTWIQNLRTLWWLNENIFL